MMYLIYRPSARRASALGRSSYPPYPASFTFSVGKYGVSTWAIWVYGSCGRRGGWGPNYVGVLGGSNVPQ